MLVAFNIKGELVRQCLRRLAVLGIVLGVGWISGCMEDEALAPSSVRLHHPGVSQELKALPSVNLSISSMPSTSVFMGNYPNPEKVLAELTILGTIDMYSHANAWYSKYNGPVDARGIYVGGVYNQCSMNVTLAGRGPACLSTDNVGSQPSWIDTALVTGNVYAVRGPGVPWLNPACDSLGSPCHTYSGSQTVAVNPLPSEFKTVITGSQFRSLNSSLYWTSTITPNAAHGIAMPLKLLSRVWLKADPADSTGAATSPACSLNERACGAWLVQAGTLIETARANGVEQVDSARIFCIDSIAVLNYVDVRKGMKAALDSSGYPLVNPFDRVEHVFFVVQDTVTPGAKPYVYIFQPRFPSDACSSYHMPEFNERPANTKLLAWGHTHPDEGSISPCKDSLGNIQKDSAGNEQIWFHNIPGPSPEDMHMAAKRDSTNYPYYVGPIYHYVVTPNNIYIIKPWQLSQAPIKKPENHPAWRRGKCAWPLFN